MKWKFVGASARGSSHQRLGRPNQDAYEHGTGTKDTSFRAILAVSDGHGGARHFRSAVGSRLAVHIAVSVLPSLIAGQMESNPVAALLPEVIPGLLRKVVEDWHAATASDLENNPFTKAELASLQASDGEAARASVEQEPVIAYGATLLLAIAVDTFLLYAQLGDGDILAVDSTGRTHRPLPPDDRLIGNQTTSLCQPDAWNEFRWSMVDDPVPVAAILVSTDGYANSFRSEKDFLQIGADYVRIIREDGLEALAEELPSILAEASEKGSGDDITLGILVNDVVYSAHLAVPEQHAASSDKFAAVRVLNKVAEAAIDAPESNHAPKMSGGKITAKASALSEAVPAVATAPVDASSNSVNKARRFSSQQRRVMVVLLIILSGTFVIERYGAFPASRVARNPQSDTKPLPVAEVAPKATNAPPQGQVWVVQAAAPDTPPLMLTVDKKITARELFRLLAVREEQAKTDKSTGKKNEPGPQLYAKVAPDKQGMLQLINLSDDPWTVQLPDKDTVEPPIGNASGVVLAEGIKITFRSGAQGHIGLAQVPTPRSAKAK